MCHVLGVEKKTFLIWWTQHCLWNPASVQNACLQFMVSRDFFWFRMNFSHGFIHGFYPHHSMTCQLDRWCCPKKVIQRLPSQWINIFAGNASHFWATKHSMAWLVYGRVIYISYFFWHIFETWYLKTKKWIGEYYELHTYIQLNNTGIYDRLLL